MKLKSSITASEVGRRIGAEVIGDPDVLANGINEIHVVEQGDIVFVDHPKYYDKTLHSSASIVIIDQAVGVPDGKAILVHPKPFSAFNALTSYYNQFEASQARIAPSADIDPSAVIHDTASIGPNAVIGKNCIIHANVSVGWGCRIDDHCIVHANSTIGGDAFYYKKHKASYEKLLSCGTVHVAEHVEIGANCTIDRGVSGVTYLGAHTKLDNQVHIGHDTVIGERCLLAAQVGIAGCVTLEDDVTMWGQVGCIANVRIGRGAVILAQSGIGKSLEGGKTYFGSPAGEARGKLKELATLSRLTHGKT